MKLGYVYILNNPGLKEGLLKIGYTGTDVKIRAKQLSTTGVPDNFIIVYKEDIFNPKIAEIAEKMIHEKLDKYRYNKKREFFEISIQKAISAVQEVTQREIYEKKKGINILGENMTFRWSCHPKDIVFILRCKTLFHAFTNNFEIVNIWSCKKGDQFLITNRVGSKKYIIDKDKYITLDVNESINGIIHDVFDIYPGDRIVWLRKSNTIFDIDNNYTILFVLDCEHYAKIAGFSDPREVILYQGLPLPFGYDPSMKKLNNINNINEIMQKLKKLDMPDTWGSPLLE
jgi:hypothetical protein